jgi:hypothetical protein
MVAALFWILLVAAAVSIALNGDRAARQFMIWIIFATAGTAYVDLYASAADSAYGHLIIDSLLLALALRYVLTQPVYWPIWFAGFQLITVTTELAQLVMPGPLPTMYADLAGFWAAPALVTMAIGTAKDRGFYLVSG